MKKIIYGLILFAIPSAIFCMDKDQKNTLNKNSSHTEPLARKGTGKNEIHRSAPLAINSNTLKAPRRSTVQKRLDCFTTHENSLHGRSFIEEANKCDDKESLSIYHELINTCHACKIYIHLLNNN